MNLQVRQSGSRSHSIRSSTRRDAFMFSRRTEARPVGVRPSVKGNQRGCTLRNPARSMLSRLSGQKPTGLCLHDGDQVNGLHKILILSILRQRQRPALAFVRRSSIWASRSGSSPEFEQRGGHLRRECLGERVQQSIQITCRRHAAFTLSARNSPNVSQPSAAVAAALLPPQSSSAAHPVWR